MKVILDSRRCHYVARVSIFLIMVALIPGMVGCVSSPTQYDITISSTEGGSVTTPGEGSFACDDGTDIDLVAEVEEGYRFVNWTGDWWRRLRRGTALSTGLATWMTSLMSRMPQLPSP